MDMNTVVRFVDDVVDGNPKTKDTCPGTLDGKKLIQVGIQLERRIGKLFFKSVKYRIYVLEGTRTIWYKVNKCYPSVVAMGFKRETLKMHKSAVPMEQYAAYFLDNSDPQWLKDNDFMLTKVEE